jgi:hypothetical protein
MLVKLALCARVSALIPGDQAGQVPEPVQQRLQVPAGRPSCSASGAPPALMEAFAAELRDLTAVDPSSRWVTMLVGPGAFPVREGRLRRGVSGAAVEQACERAEQCLTGSPKSATPFRPDADGPACGAGAALTGLSHPVGARRRAQRATTIAGERSQGSLMTTSRYGAGTTGDDRGPAAPRPAEVNPWARGFPAVMMVMIGLMHVVAGLVAIFQNQFYVVTAGYFFQFDVTAWGWIHLGLGILIGLAGCLVLSGAVWARSRHHARGLEHDREPRSPAVLPDLDDPDHRSGHLGDLGTVCVQHPLSRYRSVRALSRAMRIASARPAWGPARCGRRSPRRTGRPVKRPSCREGGHAVNG